jgi:hypothetical protein
LAKDQQPPPAPMWRVRCGGSHHTVIFVALLELDIIKRQPSDELKRNSIAVNIMPSDNWYSQLKIFDKELYAGLYTNRCYTMVMEIIPS